MNNNLESGFSDRKDDQGYILFMMLALAGIYLLYQFGFSGAWTFDDWLSLHGLNEVVDYQSAISYVLGNETGPSGRPIPMLSFLLNVADWDQHPEGFRQINVYIHLLNILLVALVGWQIARAIPLLQENAIGFAVMLALFWGVHPLFASTVLSIVQRMALLSASFVLMAINGFLYGRHLLAQNTWRGIVVLLASLGLGLILAVFSKENGALLPAFVGLLEIQILARYQPIKFPGWRTFFQLLLWMPIILFFVYVLVSWESILSAQDSSYRAFSWSERLWSELLILWEYVRQLFLPNISAMGPLQDDITRVHGMDFLTLAALVLWAAVLYCAWHFREKYPVLLFGIGFFLIGHLVESSFVQLELYFEHRNYVPALGLLAIPVVILHSGKGYLLKGVVWGLLLPLLAFLLYLVTSTWGDPILSSQRWYENHPTSLRAIQKQIKVLSGLEGEKKAADFAVSASDRMPEQINIAALALKSQCENNGNDTSVRLFKRIETLGKQPNPLHGGLGFLGFMSDTVVLRIANKCPQIGFAQLKRLLVSFLEDSSIKANPADLSRLYVTLSRIDFAQGNIDAGLEYIHQGYLLHRSYVLFGIYTRLLRNLGDVAEAERLRAEFVVAVPRGVSAGEHERRVDQAYTPAVKK